MSQGEVNKALIPGEADRIKGSLGALPVGKRHGTLLPFKSPPQTFLLIRDQILCLCGPGVYKICSQDGLL